MNLSFMSIIILVIGLIMIFLSIKIRKDSNKIRKKYNIEKGDIKYSDLNKPAKAFFSKKYRIAGKPDYIVKDKKSIIPVEFKSGFYDKPQDHHIFQLAAYCHLIEENYQKFVPYGIVKFGDNSSFKVDFNPKIRYELEQTIEDMREMIKTKKVFRNHDDPRRCLKCSLKNICNNKVLN